MLDNYIALVARVDQLVLSIEQRYGEYITCSKGCDCCCRHLSLFPVEGFAVATAVARLPAETVASLRQNALAARPDGPCPLLQDGLCAIYEARPIICRTHGLPVMVPAVDGGRIDFCPRNFNGADSLPGDAVVVLDRLNMALAAISALFEKQFPSSVPPGERLTVAEAILTGR